MKTANAEMRGHQSSGLTVHRLIGVVIVIGLMVAVAGFAALRTQADATPQVPAELENLMATAKDKGSVRVIVGLDVGFSPEGDLAGTAAGIIHRVGRKSRIGNCGPTGNAFI